jgi:hypothetical protein
MEKSYSFLYLLKLTLDQLFVTSDFSHSYIPSKDSKLCKYGMDKKGKMSGHISDDDDWQWLQGGKPDSCLGIEKTAKWSVDTTKLESLFSDILSNYNYSEPVTMIENHELKQDLKPLISLISKLLKATTVNNKTIEGLINAKAKKPPVMKGDTSYKCPDFKDDIKLAKSKTKSTADSDSESDSSESEPAPSNKRGGSKKGVTAVFTQK